MCNEAPTGISLQEARELECRVWQALLDGDPAADGAMLTDDFLGVYPSGLSGRAAHMAELDQGPVMAEYRLSQERLMPLGVDRVLFAYRADYRKQGSEKWQAMYISSIWQRTSQGWKNSFSQDTPAA